VQAPPSMPFPPAAETAAPFRVGKSETPAAKLEMPPGEAEPTAPAPARKAAQRTIREVRRLHVAGMPENLDRYIREEIHKQLADRITLVSEPAKADGVMEGTAGKTGGAGSKLTSGYFGTKAQFTGSASIADPQTGKVLWESEAGDNTAVVGMLRRGGPKKVAGRLVANLKKAMEEK
jgi:hypothetical protein